MKQTKNIDWFKKIIEPSLASYKVIYKSFTEGDFGSLNQVEFNSEKIGGTVDFWEMGWLGIHIWDYKNEKELMNVLLKPEEFIEQEAAFLEFQKIIL